MFPLKDNVPTHRVPLVTLLLLAGGLLAALLLPGGALLPLAADAVVVWICGTTVEDASSRPRYLLLCLAGGGVAVGLARALGVDGEAVTLAATGVGATVLGAYLPLAPRARIVTAVPVPLRVTFALLPAWALLVAWLLALAVSLATPAGGVLHDDPAAAALATAGGFAVGLAAAALLRTARGRARSITGPATR